MNWFFKNIESLKQIKISKNPFLLFLPFLILYIVIVFVFPTNGRFGDEKRYVMLAHHILNGYYSPPAPNIDLGNVPGYPLIVALFLGLGLPLISITVFNAFLFYFSIVFLFKSLKLLVPFKTALIVSLFWALFFSAYEYLPKIYTETLTIFLVTLFVYCSLKAFTSPKIRYIIYAGFFLGYLALTKAIFGYVIMFLFVPLLIMWISKRKSLNHQKGVFILLVAVLVTLPYLIYSYNLSGKLFYWGSNGGNNLYWMSTPYPGEYGNWIEYPIVPKHNRIESSEKILKENHQSDFDSVSKYNTTVEKDAELKKIAINNIKNYPVKFLENCFSNVGRIVFNYPFSYQLEKPSKLLRLPLNGVIVVLCLFCFVITILNWRKTLFSVRFLLFFTFLYLSGSILGSAETRMFTMIVPILLLWIAYIFDRTVKINFKLKDQNS